MKKLLILNTIMRFPTLLSNSKMVTGTKNLIADATKVGTGLAAAVTGLILIIMFFKKQNAEDEGEAKAIKKKMKSVLICGVGITLAAAIVSVVFSYYK